MEWKRLIEERNEWVEKNFPNNHIPDPGESILGCIEELGELTHHYLKWAQKIRGSEQHHIDESKDAIGDIIIYLLGVMDKTGPPKIHTVPSNMRPHETIFKLAGAVGALGKHKSRYDVEQVVGLCRRYCEQMEWDFEEIVYSTWEKVKQRDWTKNPDDGEVPPPKDPGMQVS